MDAKLAKKWAKALRSGKYKQQNWRLRYVDENTGEVSHCCLGVLCEVMGDQENALECQLYLSDIANSDLLEKAGMSESVENEFMALNSELSFEEIADAVDFVRLADAWHMAKEAEVFP